MTHGRRSFWALPLLLAATAATAETLPPSVVGRWAPKAAECSGDIVFNVKPAAFAYATFSCDRVTYAKDGASWKAHGSKCDGEEGPIPAMDFKLLVEGKSLQIDWLDGSKSDKLVRCGK